MRPPLTVSSADGAEGQITVGAGTKLDYETKQTYMVTVIATDSFGESATIDITITVTDVNEGPVISLVISLGGLAISGMPPSIKRAENDSTALATYTVHRTGVGLDNVVAFRRRRW